MGRKKWEAWNGVQSVRSRPVLAQLGSWTQQESKEQGGATAHHLLAAALPHASRFQASGPQSTD